METEGREVIYPSRCCVEQRKFLWGNEIRRDNEIFHPIQKRQASRSRIQQRCFIPEVASRERDLDGQTHGSDGNREVRVAQPAHARGHPDRKSTRLNSSHGNISYAVLF